MSVPFIGPSVSPVLQAAATADRATGRNPLEDLVVSLFDQLREPLLRYLASFGLSFPDGEEVLQETFLSLFQHLQSGKSRDNLRGWLFRVAHNLALKRRYRTRREWESRAEAASEDCAVDPGPSPEDQLLSDQTRKCRLAVVNALAEQDRRCLFLRAEGLRYREIAEVLEMSLGAVSLSLARSLARIARATDR